MIAGRRTSLLRFAFSGDHSFKVPNKTEGQPELSDHHDHHAHSHNQIDIHGLNRQNYIVEGNGTVSNLLKRWLRFAGWEPDTPRSRTESPHFNDFLNLPILNEKKYSLYKLMTYLPTSLIRLAISNVQETLEKSDLKDFNSDYIVPNQCERDSVFVYQSIYGAAMLKRFRSLETIIIPTAIFLSNYPIATIMSVGAGYFFLHAKIYLPSKVLVARLDVVPNRNSVRIEKVSWFGRTNISYVNPQDLQHVSQDDASVNSYMFWIQNRADIDKTLIFKNKKSGELYMFDRDGIWNPEGLKHPLIY